MRITNRIKDGRLSFLFLMIAIFFLPVSRELFIIALWPWILFRILEGVFRKGFPGKLYQKDHISLYFLPAYFLLMLLSVLWTNNISEGMGHVGRSMLMILFPLILGTDIKIMQDRSRIRQLLKSYVFGATLTLVSLWIYAITYSISFEGGSLSFNPLVRDWENAFFYDAFSFLIHPTYFGMMILMAAAVSLNELKPDNLFAKSLLWPVLMVILFIGSLFFISSRAMIGAAIAIVLYDMVIRISNKKVLVITLIISVLILFSMASLHPRFSHLRNMLTEETGIFSYDQLRESTDRGKTWEASLLLIKKNPVFGVGIGDVKDSMTGKYLELGFYSESDHYLNCHNQFLESWLAVGVGGLLLLLLMLLYPLLRMKLHSRFLFGSFVIVCLIAFLFESALSRLWGVAFFSFFFLLLTSTTKSETLIK